MYLWLKYDKKTWKGHISNHIYISIFCSVICFVSACENVTHIQVQYQYPTSDYFTLIESKRKNELIQNNQGYRIFSIVR